MEEICRLFLEEHKINYKYRLKPSWLNGMELDFYLPDNKIAIECQGEQHFRPVNFGSKTKSKEIYKNFIKQKTRDKKKKQLCDENGVVLYYINYDDNNINEKLTNFIKNGGL